MPGIVPLTLSESTHRDLVAQVVEALRGRLKCPVFNNAEPLPKSATKPYAIVGRGQYHCPPTRSPGQADITVAHHLAQASDATQITETQACLRTLMTRTIQQIVLADTNDISDALRIDTFGVHHVAAATPAPNSPPVSATPTPPTSTPPQPPTSTPPQPPKAA